MPGHVRTTNDESPATGGGTPPFLLDFEHALHASRARLAQHLLPAHLDPDAAVARALPGYRLDPAVSQWWRWHDGADDPRDVWVAAFDEAPLLVRLLSLEEALASRAAWIRMADPEVWDEYWKLWPPHWLPVAECQDLSLVTELSSQPGQPTRVLFVLRATPAEDVNVVARSWSTIVTWWTEMLTSGAATWNDDGWQFDEERVPAHLVGNITTRPISLGSISATDFPPLGEDQRDPGSRPVTAPQELSAGVARPAAPPGATPFR